jgi:hypothetical protein
LETGRELGLTFEMGPSMDILSDGYVPIEGYPVKDASEFTTCTRILKIWWQPAAEVASKSRPIYLLEALVKFLLRLIPLLFAGVTIDLTKRLIRS